MEQEILLTFDSTNRAIRAEQLLLDAGAPVKVMSLPSAVKAGCGICLRLPPEWLAKAAAVLGAGGADALYLRTVAGGKSSYAPLPPDGPNAS